MSPSPAESLANIILPNDWVVVGRAEAAGSPTGSFFSVGYIVESVTTGDRAFLKALNMERILADADDAVSALDAAINTFQYERDLCHRCRSMDKVVTIVDSGQVTTNPNDPMTVVPYLIFEQANGDIRAFLEAARDLDVAWALRSLHHIATGLSQLHRADIAHQDLKPSNVLVFGPDLSKVADLGRASNRSMTGPFDNRQAAGAVMYAPPELLYGQLSPEFNERRLACDVYLLGSMLSFFFCGASMTALLMQRIQKEQRPKLLSGAWDGDYTAILPVIQRAFAHALMDFRRSVPQALADDLVVLLRELCDPDPKRRGSSRARRRHHPNPFELEYFVSRFNALACRAEARVRLSIS